MSKPSNSRPRHGLALRLAAALSVAIWTVATGFCSLENAVGHFEGLAQSEHHGADHRRAETTSPLPEGSQQSDDSHPGNHHEDICCSSLNSALPAIHSIAFAKPDFGSPFTLSSACVEQLPVFGQATASFSRRAFSEDLLFTPELFLGPAFRGNAPPSFA